VVTPRKSSACVDSYALCRLQGAAYISDDQFPKFLPRFKAACMMCGGQGLLQRTRVLTEAPVCSMRTSAARQAQLRDQVPKMLDEIARQPSGREEGARSGRDKSLHVPIIKFRRPSRKTWSAGQAGARHVAPPGESTPQDMKGSSLDRHTAPPRPSALQPARTENVEVLAAEPVGLTEQGEHPTTKARRTTVTQSGLNAYLSLRRLRNCRGVAAVGDDRRHRTRAGSRRRVDLDAVRNGEELGEPAVRSGQTPHRTSPVTAVACSGRTTASASFFGGHDCLRRAVPKLLLFKTSLLLETA